jgi:hypothetical protein
MSQADVQTLVSNGTPYSVWCLMLHYQYKSQRAPVDRYPSQIVVAESVDDWKAQIFMKLKHFVKGSYQLADGKATPSFAGPEPSFEEYAGHILIYHNHRLYMLSSREVDHHLLLRMKQAYSQENPMVVKVYDYGVDATRQVFEDIQSNNAVSQDRAGAIDVETKFQMIRLLKETHKNKWASPMESSWMMWAMEILKKRQRDQDAAAKEDPPMNIRHLFRHPDAASDAQLRRVFQQAQFSAHLLATLRREDTEAYERKMAIYDRYSIFLDSIMESSRICLSHEMSREFEQLVCNVLDTEHED